jgi:hypothetical protein
MNLRKLSMLTLFSIAAFPAIAHVRPAQKDPVVHQVNALTGKLEGCYQT